MFWVWLFIPRRYVVCPEIGKYPLMSFRNGLGSRAWVLNSKSPDSRFTQASSFKHDPQVPVVRRRMITQIATLLRIIT